MSSMDKTGPENKFYSIPFYYGSRVKDWNNTKTFFEDQPVQFFWSYSWNIDYLGNIWIVDKILHTVYYISKENATYNAIFKVSGTENKPGDLNGNVASAFFNKPTSVFVYDDNPNNRYLQDNLRPIIMHDKFFKPDIDKETKELRDRCFVAVGRNNYTLCGTLVPDKFVPPREADEEYHEIMHDMNDTEREAFKEKMYLKWARVDHKRIKLVPMVETTRKFYHDSTIDPRIVYIADSGNHCIRRILIKQANVDTFAGTCGQKGFKDGIFG